MGSRGDNFRIANRPLSAIHSRFLDSIRQMIGSCHAVRDVPRDGDTTFEPLRPLAAALADAGVAAWNLETSCAKDLTDSVREAIRRPVREVSVQTRCDPV